MKATKTKKLVINAPLKDYRVGQEIEIEVDQDGVPLGRYWRDRLKEAEIDGCVEFAKTSKGSKK